MQKKTCFEDVAHFLIQGLINFDGVCRNTAHALKKIYTASFS